MKKLHFTKHLLDKIKIRKISKALIKAVVESPESIYYDSLNGTNIAVRKMEDKYYMVAFSESNTDINAITVHPVKEKQIKNRVKSRRWIKITS